MSNLLSKASILLTPTATSDGTLHSVKPVQTFGSELVTNGDFATDSNWAVNAGWSISDGKANIDTDNGTDIFSQSSVLVVGKKYKLSLIANVTVGSIKFESGEGDNLVFTSDIDSHIFIADRTQVVFRRQVTPTRGYIDNVSVVEVTDGDFDFTRATTATRVNSSGLIESVASGLPRIDFLGGTGQILLEPASTNTATYSNDFSQGSNFNSGNRTLSDCVLSTSQGTAPDGTNTAQKLTDNNNGGTGSISLNSFGAGLTSNTDSTVSMFVKKDTVRYFVIKFLNFDTTQETSFDLDTGTVNRGSGDMTDYGNGWYRCSATFSTTTDLVGAIQFLITNSSSTTGGNLRDGSNSTLVWGYQAEESSFATSYIPTSGSSVTRNKDEANNSGDTSLINSTEGVLYVEIAALANDTTSRSISLTSGNNTDRVTIQYRNASNALNAFYRSSNVNIGQIFFSATDITQFSKIAYKYKENDFALFVDGVKVGSVTSGSFSSNLTALSFDRTNSNDTQFFGKVKSVAVFKEALTDAQLISLTS